MNKSKWDIVNDMLYELLKVSSSTRELLKLGELTEDEVKVKLNNRAEALMRAINS